MSLHLIYLFIQSSYLHVSINDCSLKLSIEWWKVIKICRKSSSFISILNVCCQNDLTSYFFFQSVNFMKHSIILSMQITNRSWNTFRLLIALINVSHMSLFINQLGMERFYLIEFLNSLINLHLKFPTFLHEWLDIIFIVLLYLRIFEFIFSIDFIHRTELCVIEYWSSMISLVFENFC